MKRRTKRVTWSSRSSFWIASVGASLGLGNAWKFSYEMGENGGAAFLYSYLFCLFLVAFPLMIAELIVGRYAKRNPISGIAKVAEKEYASTMWRIIGVLAVITGLIVFSYYSVVASWILFYTMKSARGGFVDLPAEFIRNQFDALLLNTDQLLIWHTVFVLMVVLVLTRGLLKGIELALWILMPCFLIMLVWLAMKTMEVGDIDQAMEFMLRVHLDDFTMHVFINAFSQALFSLSIGLGVILTYGAYMRSDRPIFGISFITLTFNLVSALLMSVIVFSIVFAFDMQVNSGPGLLFQALPVAFSQMPNGMWWSTLFFFSMLIAAWVSAFSLLEPCVAWLVEQFRFSRRLSAWLVGLVVWVMGLLSVYAFSDLKFRFYFLEEAFTHGFFDFFNIFTSFVLMPLTILLLAFFTGWVMHQNESPIQQAFHFKFTYKIWLFSIRIIVPIVLSVIVISALLLSALSTLT